MAAVLMGGTISAVPDLAAAARERSQMQVVAKVVPLVRMLAVDVPTLLLVDDRDFTRGVIDVSARYELYSNARDGYRIRIESALPFIESIEVAGLGRRVRLGTTGGELVERPDRVVHETVTLHFRLWLHGAPSSGSFDWPLLLSAEPL